METAGEEHGPRGKQIACLDKRWFQTILGRVAAQKEDEEEENVDEEDALCPVCFFVHTGHGRDEDCVNDMPRVTFNALDSIHLHRRSRSVPKDIRRVSLFFCEHFASVRPDHERLHPPVSVLYVRTGACQEDGWLVRIYYKASLSLPVQDIDNIFDVSLQNVKVTCDGSQQPW